MISKFLYALSQWKMETPGNYGVFHLCSIAVLILLTVFFCVRLKDCSLMTERIFIGSCWGLIALLEIAKQLVYAIEMTDGGFFYTYKWFAFPFQLCSTPLYVLPLVAFLPQGKVREACVAYSSLFAIFGGVAVMIYPGNVFSGMTLINFQTMIHHGVQVLTGVFLGRRYLHLFSRKFFLEGMAVFAVLCSVALTLDLVIPLWVDATFNMFFISPYFGSELPILCDIRKVVPYPIYLAIYLVGFGIAAALIYAFFRLCRKISARIRHEKLSDG